MLEAPSLLTRLVLPAGAGHGPGGGDRDRKTSPPCWGALLPW